MLSCREVEGNKFPYAVNGPSQRHENCLAVFVRPLVSRPRIVLSNMLTLGRLTSFRVLKGSGVEIQCNKPRLTKIIVNSLAVLSPSAVSTTLCRQSSTYFEQSFFRGHCGQISFLSRGRFILSPSAAKAAGATTR
jgi:hypothetical protein